MNIERNELVDVYVGSPTPDSIECRGTLPLRAPAFEDCPDRPILALPLMIEIMAQTGGFIHMLKTDFARMLYMTRVLSAEFHVPARPGDAITMRSEVEHWGDGFIVCQGRISRDVDDRLMATSKLMLKTEPFLSDTMRHAFVSVLPSRGTGGPTPFRY